MMELQIAIVLLFWTSATQQRDIYGTTGNHTLVTPTATSQRTLVISQIQQIINNYSQTKGEHSIQYIAMI